MRTAQEKMQIKAIDSHATTYGVDSGDYVLLVDGWKGAYIKKDKLIVNLDRIKKPTSTGNLNYHKFEKEYIPAIVTKSMMIVGGNRILIKIKATEGNIYCWVRYDWLKEYGLDKRMFVDPKSNQSPVYISEHSGEPCGIILPVSVMVDEETEV